MSLGVVFKSPEGLVLAADSRVTVTGTLPVSPTLAPVVPGAPTPPAVVQLLPAYFDSATKLLSVKSQRHIGFLTYGAGSIGQTEPRTAHGYIPELETHLATQGTDRLSVEAFAREVSTFYLQQWTTGGMPLAPLPPNIQPMIFLIAGFDEGEPHGKVFEVSIPNQLDPVEHHRGTFGIIWGGMTQFLERFLNGVDPQAAEIAKTTLNLDDAQVNTLKQKWMESLVLAVPYQFLPLQDCVDMATFLVSITSEIQTWMVSIRGVGGDVDVATITRTEGFVPISQKHIHSWGGD